jgi:hypothetical protein
VILRHTEIAIDPVSTVNGASEFSRVKGLSVMLSLARLIRQNDRWPADESYSPKSPHTGEQVCTHSDHEQ